MLGGLNNFRTSTFGVVLFYGYLIAIGVTAFLLFKVIGDNRETASQAKRGLCALKQERVKRVEQSEDILRHPNKPNNVLIIKSFGKNFIVRSIKTSRADLAALKDVSC